ncbi:MAG: hypothetical protein V9F01_11955 [Chitinophagaceae bacterium]
MKKLLTALLSFAFVSVNAQTLTVDEVIQKYSTNMGGLEAFNKVKTAKITGGLTSQGNDMPFTMQIVNGQSMRMDVDAMGKIVTNVYNKGKGWKVNPYAGAETPTEVTGAELQTLKPQASLANNLMDYKNRGHQVELLGQEDVEGIKTYKIKLTTKDDSKVTTYFIDIKDFLLIKSVSKREIAGNQYDAETFYSDIKEIGGIKFSMNFIQKIEGQVFQEVKYDKVELNVEVDAKIFEMPK